MSAQNLETLAKRYVELKSRIADLQEEADGLKAELMEDREPGEYAAGPLTVKIRKGKRNLDARAFERRFPVQQTPTAIGSNRRHCPKSSARSASQHCAGA